MEFDVVLFQDLYYFFKLFPRSLLLLVPGGFVPVIPENYFSFLIVLQF